MDNNYKRKLKKKKKRKKKKERKRGKTYSVGLCLKRGGGTLFIQGCLRSWSVKSTEIAVEAYGLGMKWVLERQNWGSYGFLRWIKSYPAAQSGRQQVERRCLWAQSHCCFLFWLLMIFLLDAAIFLLHDSFPTPDPTQ